MEFPDSSCVSTAAAKKSAEFVLPPGLLLSTDFPPMLGGIASYLFSVYSDFRLDKLTLIAPSFAGSPAFDATQNYRAERIEPSSAFRGWRVVDYVVRTYERAKPLARRDPRLVLHCGHIRAAFAARRLKKRFGTPYLVWTHALEIMDKLLARPIRNALCEADLVLTNSEYTQNFVRSLGVPQSRLATVRPGTSAERFGAGAGARALASGLGLDGKRVLLTIGTLQRRFRYKGQDMVIRALPEVVRRFPDVLYLIAGAGDDSAYLQRLAQECSVASHVRVLGPVEAADIPLLYHCCDIFLMCSREERTFRGMLAEGFGVVFLEASASGKPIIAGNSGGVPDAVRNGVTGLLVDPRSAAEIRDAILRLLGDASLRHELGTNGRVWVEREMTLERAAQQFRRAYNNAFPRCPITC